MQTHHPLDDVHMNAIDRVRAKALMRRAELIVNFVARAVANTHFIIPLVERRVMNAARRIQTLVVNPAQD